jgi:hypothetical protein
MPAHQIMKDGYSTVLKTTVQHSPEFWRMIDELFKLDGLIDVRDPLDVTSEVEFDYAMSRLNAAMEDYAETIAPGCAGYLSHALKAHLDRLRFEAADKADAE